MIRRDDEGGPGCDVGGAKPGGNREVPTGTYELNRTRYLQPDAVEAYDAKDLKWTEAHIFDHFFAGPGRVLDLGCGTGRTSAHLANKGHEVVAIDCSPAMIRRAIQKRSLPIRFAVMDASNLALQDGLFDYCLFSFNGLDLLCPLESRTRALREVYRVLKPGGVFAFSSHNSLFVPNTPGRLWGLARTAMRLKIAPYRWSFHPYGAVLMRYIAPAVQVRELQWIGFVNVRVISKYSASRRVITLKDPYPSYVCFKRA